MRSIVRQGAVAFKERRVLSQLLRFPLTTSEAPRNTQNFPWSITLGISI